ncbi:unnamed protein product, partial [marine sediment metagenome]
IADEFRNNSGVRTAMSTLYRSNYMLLITLFQEVASFVPEPY